MIDLNANLVNIICRTYNHENYIKKAISSFLEQITEFDFKIIVYDDASTDGTKEILKSLKAIHPNKIELILSETNYYELGELGELEVHRMISSKVDSKYIAFCEGDDYWIDKFKLQFQFNFLEKNPDYFSSAHRAIIVNLSNIKIGLLGPYLLRRVLSTSEIIRNGGGYLATNSIFIKSEIYLSYPINFLGFPIGDHPIQILMSLYGKVHYTTRLMSAYRNRTPGGWTDRISNLNFKDYLDVNHRFISMYQSINEYSKFQFNYEFKSLEAKLNIERLLESARSKRMGSASLNRKQFIIFVIGFIPYLFIRFLKGFVGL